jgi:Polyketide cyclase / dehydrase and lipid transport
MARYTGTVTSPHSPDEVWQYLADLRSVAEWDPSVKDAKLISGTPGRTNARYEIVVAFMGQDLILPYQALSAEAPTSAVFIANTSAVRVRDELAVAPVADGGCVVTWDANLALQGPRRLLDLPLRAAFGRIGSQAEQGLAERLSDPVLQPVREQTRA